MQGWEQDGLFAHSIGYTFSGFWVPPQCIATSRFGGGYSCRVIRAAPCTPPHRPLHQSKEGGFGSIIRYLPLGKVLWGRLFQLHTVKPSDCGIIESPGTACCLQNVPPLSTQGEATAPPRPEQGEAAAGDDLDSLMRRNAAALDAIALEAKEVKAWSLQAQKGKGQPGPAMRPN